MNQEERSDSIAVTLKVMTIHCKRDLSKKAVKKCQTLYDSGIKLASLREPQYEGMIWEMEFLKKELILFSKIDEVKAHEKLQENVNHLVNLMLKVSLAYVKKKEKEYEKSGKALGLVEAHVVLNVVNWNQQSLNKNKIEITLRGKKVRATTFSKIISGGNVRFRGIMIPKEGDIAIKIAPLSKKLKTSEHSIKYAVKKGEVRFKAELIPRTDKFESGGFENIGKRVGDGTEKGLGVEWGPVSIDRKKTTMKEAQKTRGNNTKRAWVIHVPSGGMRLISK